MSIDELDQWLDALAGREGESGSAEGRALRAHIKAQPAEQVTPVAVTDALREAQLVARARKAGLLPAQQSPFSHERSARSSRWALPRLLVAAAVLGSVVIGLGTLHLMQAPTERFRGAVNGVAELESSDPTRLKQQLMKELKVAGVKATGYERLNREGLDADLPVPVSSKVEQVLERHHVPVPQDGVLVIEIHLPESP